MDKKTYLLWGLEALVITLIIGLTILGVREARNAQAVTDAGVGLTVDPNAGVYTAPKPEPDQDPEDSGGIAIPGWGSITIAANETEVDVNLMNPEDNAERYELVFTIYLDGEEEPIAQTGRIPAGKSALRLKLERALEPGEYQASILVQPYRVDSLAQTNNAVIETVLIAE